MSDMVFTGHIQTDKQGSDITFEFFIVDDEELECKTPEEREAIISAECWQMGCNYVDAWWEVKE